MLLELLLHLPELCIVLGLELAGFPLDLVEALRLVLSRLGLSHLRAARCQVLAALERLHFALLLLLEGAELFLVLYLQLLLRGLNVGSVGQRRQLARHL